MTAFISRLDADGAGVRLAVKDIIDVEGVVTTAGCKAVAQDARPAEADAGCLAGARTAGASIVGKTNLHELALGVSGVNPWYGTPVNPLDPDRVPGGSSSGSAVAVATGEADVALGTDTGGSVRIPSACCGTAGLKTTWGRISLDGVMPLAPSLDTVGPMARDVQGLVTGMQLLEPGFRVAEHTPGRVGRLRRACDPSIEAAVDRALGSSGWELVEIEIPEWDEAEAHCGVLLVAEAWESNRRLVESSPDLVGPEVRDRLRLGAMIDSETLSQARSKAEEFTSCLDRHFSEVEILALPTLAIFPPRIEAADLLLSGKARFTLPVNFAGLPALSMPVPTTGPFPASLQLVAGKGGEELLLAAGLHVERAVNRLT